MQIIETSPCESLGRTMLTTKPTNTITAAEHDRRFFALDTCDVWTTDGWLITAVGNGVHHIRKDRLRGTAIIADDEELHYTPNAKSLQYIPA